MCEIIERNRREAAAEAAAKAKIEGKIENVRNMIKAGLTNLAAVKASGLYTKQELAAIAAP